MSIPDRNIDQLLRDERARQKRIDNTYLAVVALTDADRLQLLVRIVDEVVGAVPMRRHRVGRSRGDGGTTTAETASGGETTTTTIRSAITQVLALGEPLGARAITERIQSIRPGTSLSAVHGELIRMRSARIVVQRGIGANNGGLYTFNGQSATGTT